MVCLDRGGWSIGVGSRFDHVGVQRSLGQELRIRDRLGFLAKHLDEHPADDFSFLLWVGHVGEFIQELALSVGDMQVGLEMVGESFLDLTRLAGAQQAIVDEDTRELVTDGPREQCGDDGGIHSTGETADDSLGTDPGPDFFDLLFDERTDVPGALASTNILDKVFQQLATEVGVSHLGVKLQAVDGSLGMPDSGQRAGVGGCQRHEHAVRIFHLVSVAHPNDQLVGKPGEQAAGIDNPAG